MSRRMPAQIWATPDRVGDELVAGVAELVGVAVAGEFEGVPERLAVDRRQGDDGGARALGGVAVPAGGGVELLDHGEEVGEKLAAL